MNEDTNLYDLLPDYLQGRLSSAETSYFESALNKNAHLRAELEFLTKLSENLKADADDFEPGEFGWSRLNRDIDASMPDQSGESQTPKYPATPKFWRYAAMALAVLSVGQGALLIQKPTQVNENARYVTVSSTSQDYVGAIIGFNPEASEAELREVLHASHAEIISGPSPLGLYTVRFTTTEQRAKAMRIYAQQSSVIETATPD